MPIIVAWPCPPAGVVKPSQGSDGPLGAGTAHPEWKECPSRDLPTVPGPYSLYP